MKNRCLPNILFALCSVIGLAACATAESPADTQPDAKTDTFGAWVEAFRKKQNILSLSVVVLRDGKTVHSSYLGYQDDEGEVPTTAQTSYFVASVTKPVTGTALFLAHENGVFDLDRPVTDSVRWRDSFCQWYPSSGIIFAGGQLGDVAVPPFSCDGVSFRDVVNMHANGTPGTTFLYNPIAYANLSRAFEDLTTGTFRDFLHRTVLEPADMGDTAAGWRDKARAHVLSNLAMPHAVRDGKLSKQALPDDDFRAAAGLYMTPGDLARFDRALDDRTLVTASQREQLWTPPRRPDGTPSLYAHGWHIQDWNGERLIWHGGWEPEKYSAIYLKVPDRSLTLIALANTEALYWGNPLNDVRVHESPLVEEFLRQFMSK